jgi:hypothetical protein
MVMLQRNDSACMAVMGSSIAQVKQSCRFIGIQVFEAIEVGSNAQFILYIQLTSRQVHSPGSGSGCYV